MRRALPGVVGVLVTVAAVIAASSASAKFPALWRQSQPPVVQKTFYEDTPVSLETNYRQEEMRVELALLADPTTFPYDLGVHAAGETLELHGCVPNERTRTHALHLARGSTFLRVCDQMRIQDDLILMSSQYPAARLQKEAAALLAKHLGGMAQAMAIGVRSPDRVVVAGPIDSMERKLAVSRLFRQLPGCHGVVNELSVQPIPHPGSPVVQATLKRSLLPPPSPQNAKPPALTGSPPRSTPIIPVSVGPPKALPVALSANTASTPAKVLLTLPIKILVDQAEPTLQTIWEKRLRQRVEEASDILEQHCGVRLEVIDVGTWESDPKLTKLSELLQDFQKKVAVGKARLVIGFTGLRASREEDTAPGCTRGPLHTHILIREWKPRTEPERLEVLVHELGHFLGARHSSERDSVMRPRLGDGRVNLRAFRIGFDAVNAQAMRLVAKELTRGPVHGLEDLSPSTCQRLLELFSTTAGTMPEDPAPAETIRRHGGASRESLSARSWSRE